MQDSLSKKLFDSYSLASQYHISSLHANNGASNDAKHIAAMEKEFKYKLALKEKEVETLKQLHYQTDSMQKKQL